MNWNAINWNLSLTSSPQTLLEKPIFNLQYQLQHSSWYSRQGQKYLLPQRTGNLLSLACMVQMNIKCLWEIPIPFGVKHKQHYKTGQLYLTLLRENDSNIFIPSNRAEYQRVTDRDSEIGLDFRMRENHFFLGHWNKGISFLASANIFQNYLFL